MTDDKERITIKSLLEDNQEVVTEEKGTLKVSEKVQKFFKPQVGNKYYVSIRDDTIMFVDFAESKKSNSAEEKNQEEKMNVETTDVEETKNVQKKAMSPIEHRSLQQQIGGLTHDAVQIAISRGNLTPDSIKDDIRMLKDIQDDLVKEYEEKHKNS